MPHQQRVDVTPKQIKGLKLGQSVTIITKGKIVELRDEEKMEAPAIIGGGKTKVKQETFPPVIVVDVKSTRVDSENAFAKLAEDDDE